MTIETIVKRPIYRTGSLAFAAVGDDLAPGFRHRPRFFFNAEGGGSGEGDEGEDKTPEGIAASMKAKEDAAAVEAKRKEEAAAAEAAKSKQPSDAEAKLLKENMKLKEKAKDADELREKLKSFEGIDPDAVRAVLAEKAEKETKALEDKGEWERVKGIMAEAHKTEVKELKERIAALQGDLKTRDGELDDITIGHQFTASKFIADELTIGASHARKLYGGHVERKDGKLVVFDKPAGTADRAPIVGSDGETLPFEDAMRQLVDKDPEHERLKRSKVRPGANGGGDNRNDRRNQDDPKGLTGQASMSAALAARMKK